MRNVRRNLDPAKELATSSGDEFAPSQAERLPVRRRCLVELSRRVHGPDESLHLDAVAQLSGPHA
jgi:hypothetical protein